MNKEKLESLNKYAQDLRNRLTSSVPSKHVKHPQIYKNFLNNELRIVTAKLEEAKLEGVK